MMCAQLKALADAAEPTAVHRLMKEMEQAGKLFRVYTQVRLPPLEGRLMLIDDG